MKRRTLARVVDDAQVWRERIVAAHDKGLEAVFETGRLLVEAKSALPHGSFLRMVKSELPFTRRWASTYMRIASDPRLSNGNPSSHLPSEVKTLVELTKLDDGAYALAEERGLIRPDVTRKEIVELRREIAGPVEPKPEPQFSISDAESAIGNLCVTLMKTCPPEWLYRLAEVFHYYGEVVARADSREAQ